MAHTVRAGRATCLTVGISLVLIAASTAGALAQGAGASPEGSPPAASPAADAPARAAWPSVGLPGAEDITTFGDRFVVVGSDGTFPGRAQAWTSTDGTTWEPATVADASDGTTMTAVTATDGGLVAFGTAMSRGADGPDRVAAWTSADGTTWAQARVRRAGSRDLGAGVRHVADGPGGVIALASFFGQDVGPARLYRTTDGQAWQAFRPPRVRNTVWSSIAAIPEGYLLMGNTFDGKPRTFSSTDGETWTRVSGAPWLLDAVAAPAGPIVGISTAAMVSTPDLVTWSEVATAPDAAAGSEADTPSIEWVDWDGSRFAFSSSAYSGCPEGVDECYQRYLLLSPDGVTWTESTGPDGEPGPDAATSFAGMASLGDTTVVLGSAGAGPTRAWVMPTP